MAIPKNRMIVFGVLFLVCVSTMLSAKPKLIDPWVPYQPNKPYPGQPRKPRLGHTILPNGAPKSNARSCTYPPFESYAAGMMSQSQEDAVLMKFLAGLCGGTYIEMGALDGLKYSNSHVFSKHFGFRGVLIEANPMSYKQLRWNRDRDEELAMVYAAVCEKERTLHYMLGKVAATAGIWEFMSEEFRKTWHEGSTKEDGILLECKPLQKILDEELGYENYFFDFFSLDIEGAELEALRSLDFSRTAFGVVLVEADHTNKEKEEAILAILKLNGYVFLKEQDRSYWFYNERWRDIYSDRIPLPE